MKENYTISIADIQLNVKVDGSRDKVERIVGIIDRRMRDILLKSRQCPKTQAALICALDFCAEKLEAKEDIERLKGEILEVSESLKRAEDKAERGASENKSLKSEKARLELENAKLKELLAANNIEYTPIEEAEADNESAQPEIIVCDDNGQADKKNSRSRVGSMFDLLTFSDI